MRVKHRSLVSSVQIVADGEGLVSRAGTSLVVGMADRLGLSDGLCAALETCGNAARGTIRAEWCVTWR